MLNNERGFHLVYALVLALISLSFTITSVTIYMNEIDISRQLEEQLDVEMLIQLGEAKLIENISLAEFKASNVLFEFPNGITIIEYLGVSGEGIEVLFKIETSGAYQVELPGYINENKFVTK